MEIVKLMVAKGADDWNGGLKGACFGGRVEIVRLMAAKGATNWNGGLFGACRGGHMEIVRLILPYLHNGTT